MRRMSFSHGISFRLLKQFAQTVVKLPGGKGPYSNDVYTIFRILDPLPPCLHFGKIHSSKSTQPPLLCLHFVNPLPPQCRRHLSMAPKNGSYSGGSEKIFVPAQNNLRENPDIDKEVALVMLWDLEDSLAHQIKHGWCFPYSIHKQHNRR